MIKTITWNINKTDGSYVGQSTAFAEQTAFIQCMAVKGACVVEREIEIEEMAGRAARITYQAEDFILRPSS